MVMMRRFAWCGTSQSMSDGPEPRRDERLGVGIAS